MNIFYLDRSIARAVRFHSDAHIVKMPLETAQILCAALHRHGLPAPYKLTHARHPCVLWAGDNALHYKWLRRFGLALCAEYTHRYGKVHACQAVIESLPEAPPFPSQAWSDPPQAMPEAFQGEDTVEAYRRYYRAEKAFFARKGPATWTHRRKPEFMKG